MLQANTTPISPSLLTESRGELSLRARRRFDGFHLDVQFDTPLSFTALLGVSGAGKSLTLRSLAGLLRPDEGRIILDGRVLFDSQRHIFLPPQERHIGYVPQHSALFPHQTVAEHVRFALPVHTSRIEKAERVAKLLAILELDGLERRYPDALSGGQQRRVALARALAANPQLLVLDEPFSALDVPVREKLYEVMRQLHQQFALPVILVTHDRAEVEQLADTVVVVQQGRVAQVGSVEDVFQAPRTADVARLVGQDNLFGGEITTSSSTQEGAPAAAIRVAWWHYGRSGFNEPSPARASECGWLPLPTKLEDPSSHQVSGCIYADMIHVTRWPGASYPQQWTREGAVQLLATLSRIQRLGPSFRLHFHPHVGPASNILEVYLNTRQWQEIAGACGETYLLKISPQALHVFTQE